MKYLICLLSLIPLSAESLHYSINWPSGLSLGEATLRSDRSAGPEKAPSTEKGKWDFGLDIDASVPGFVVRDHYNSNASADLCSAQLEKNFTHGKRTGSERNTFDQDNKTVTRETLNGGGKTEASVNSCARDAMTYLQFARQELAQGRLVPQQQVVLGALYQVRMEYTGAQTIQVGDKKVDSDRIVASIRGPQSDYTIEIFFARDAARTPLLAKVPLALGTFSIVLEK